MIILYLGIFSLVGLSYQQTGLSTGSTCPMIYCDDYLGDDVCYLHSGTNPVTFLRFTQCLDPKKVCYIGEDYAWADYRYQFYSSGKKSQNS